MVNGRHLTMFGISQTENTTEFTVTSPHFTTELFLVPASAPQLRYVLACLWDGENKRALAANQKEWPMKWHQ